jgi:hypothetical protein
VIQPPSSIHFEIGEGDAATGKSEAVFLASSCRFIISLLAELPREFHLASAATAASACVVDLDPMGFRQFQECDPLVGLDGHVALGEADGVARLGELKRFGLALDAARNPAGSEAFGVKICKIEVELLEALLYLRRERLHCLGSAGT